MRVRFFFLLPGLQQFPRREKGLAIYFFFSSSFSLFQQINRISQIVAGLCPAAKTHAIREWLSNDNGGPGGQGKLFIYSFLNG